MYFDIDVKTSRIWKIPCNHEGCKARVNLYLSYGPIRFHPWLCICPAHGVLSSDSITSDQILEEWYESQMEAGIIIVLEEQELV